MTEIALIGEGIENPHNARAMASAAEMFASACSFIDNQGLAAQWPVDSDPPATISCDDVLRAHDVVLALDNRPGAKSIFGYRAPPHRLAALVAGNERRGLSHRMLTSVTDLIEIPMASKKVNSINVASACAVALYYLANRFGGDMSTRSHPQKRRPELLLIGGSEHVELGSAIRSAGAFGWNRVFVEDRGRVWFGGEHGARREARAAARRAKNAIHVIPTQADYRYRFECATIVTCSRQGTPLHRAKLAQGPSQLIVLADEGASAVLQDEALERFANRVEVAHIELPASQFRYGFRLAASIAMAESARQIGRKAPGRPGRQEPLYEHALQTIATNRGELVLLDELVDY